MPDQNTVARTAPIRFTARMTKTPTVRLFSQVVGGCLTIVAGTTALLAQANAPTTSAPAPAVARTVNVGEVGVAFWNIQWFPGRRPAASPQDVLAQTNAVHQEMSRLNADVIGMEEIRDWRAAELAIKSLAGFKVDVCSNFPPREDQVEAQQIVIASRLPAMSAWSEQWKAGRAVAPPRGFAFAAYEVAPRQILLVYAVHLKSNAGDNPSENIAFREESARQLLDHMKAMADAYGKLGKLTWVVGGDFNTSLDDTRFEEDKSLRSLLGAGFKWAWQEVPFEKRVTLPPSRNFPPACFDHIIYRGALLRAAGLINTTGAASDHRALRATLDLTRD